MGSPLCPSLVDAFFMFSLDKYGSMIAMKVLNLYITEDMYMI